MNTPGQQFFPIRSTLRAVRRIVPALLATLAWMPCLAQTGGPSINATVYPTEVRPGGTATYRISIESGVPEEIPKLDIPKELEQTTVEPAIDQGPAPSSRRGMTLVTTLTWQFNCPTLGEYTIPPQELLIRGRKFKTPQVRLAVKENPANDLDPALQLEVGKREFYVGEVVPLTVNLVFHSETELRRVGLIELPKDNFAIQRFPQHGDSGQIVMGGKIYNAIAYSSTVSAMQPGKFTLGPATAEIIIEMPTGDPRTRNLPMMAERKEMRKMRPACNDIEVTVLPLPTEGQPKGFTNLVGDFEIDIRAEPLEVGLNDPIAVELTITGTGNFDAVSMPAITDTTSWKIYSPRRYNVQSGDNLMDGAPRSIGFTQVIVPKKKVNAIPPFEISFFSPTKKKYETLRTLALPIAMKATVEPLEAPPATADDLATTKGAATDLAPDKVPVVKPKITDILANLPEQPTWLAARPSLWADKAFLTANLMAAGALALIILGKLGAVAWHAHATSPLAPTRRLWSKLNGSTNFSRSRFYALAASYIVARGLTGERVQAILDRHHLVNYGKATPEAEEPIPHDEKQNALDALRA